MNRNSQRGVALVITLIMLAMVTVMAVLFLGISRRERSSVTVSASLIDAKNAADSGQARALSEIIARITAQSNLFAYDFLVSTNFINPNGFRPGLTSLTNVSYVYAGNGQPLNRDADIRQNQVNLFYDSRPPVFVVTNLTNGASEFRFYLDLNRNGRFDTNGPQFVFNTNGVRVGFTNLVGDPEWIGILEHPDWPHSPSNRFIARTAFVVVPAGKTLDINYIHNNARNLIPGPTVQIGYVRNQGVGPWEINLAAFLRDLNTNVWNAPGSYVYNPPVAKQQLGGVGGFAFSDALSILTNRYVRNGPNWMSPVSVNRAFGGRADSFIRRDQINEYSDGPIMTGTSLPIETGNVTSSDDPTKLWSGANNTNGFSSIQELFDPTKTSVAFTNRLRQALAGPGTYNQNTFYRLMAQLGTDSLAANRGKLNLNYVNVDPTTGALDPAFATNFISWNDTDLLNGNAARGIPKFGVSGSTLFFTNAADLMLRTQSSNALSVAYIPIYPTNFYSPRVHRLLQLAANITDSVTNRFLLFRGTNMNYYAPSVFRPLFRLDGTNVVISGYQEVTNINQVLSSTNKWVDLNLPRGFRPSDGSYGRDEIGRDPGVNVYGVPLVIGVKKGLPNFNEFLLETTTQVTRRLEAIRNRPQESVRFRQSYQFAITNTFAAEAWNSYTQAFPRPLTLILTNRAWLVLSNGNTRLPIPNPNTPLTVGTNLSVGAWAGWNAGEGAGPSFKIPMNTNVLTFPEATILANGRIEPAGTNSVSFESLDNFFPVPDLKLYITNRLQYALVDTLSGRVLDFANLDGINGGLDFTRWLVTQTNEFADKSILNNGSFWVTNRPGVGLSSQTWGISNQIYVSTNDLQAKAVWTSYSDDTVSGSDKEKAVDNIRKLMGLLPIFDKTNTKVPYGTNQVPFTPTRKLDQQLSFQASDPLVHYTLDDLYDPAHADTNNVQALKPSMGPPASNIGNLNERFQPWGGKPGSTTPANAYDLGIKDPLIMKSDDWDFPTNQFPNIGWLGRVHRGTPWQTVYLKSSVEPPATWATWAGRNAAHPTNDWPLLSLFTTAINDNAARGLMSVNQTNIAALSAVLSGVCVLSNTLASAPSGALPVYTPLFVEPASPQLQYILTNINATRLQRPGQAFENLGSMFASPALTVFSPYLNLNLTPPQKFPLVSDEMYERIPQQILSLLKDDEPYVVIYAFGQSLRPAENSIVRTPGPYRNLCTNYVVTGEVATKTAVRIEKLPLQQGKQLYRAVVESYNIVPND